ncbi:MAG: ABC transporter permease [Alphaproteobacteria bacterium]|nr:ABC transporter permease [Alphaproteobacteria bacterium]
MLGIIIGVAAVVTMVGIGRGAYVLVSQQIRSLGTNLLMVAPGAARQGAARLEAGSRHTLTEGDAAAIAREGHLVEAAANRNWRTRVNGTTPDYFIIREWPAGAGQGFTEDQVVSAAKVAFIGATVADALFPDEDPLGRSIRIGTVPFTVIGVLSEKGPSGSGRDQDDIVFVPITTAKLRLFGGMHRVNRRAVNYILLKVRQAGAMAEAEAQIATLLRVSGGAKIHH